MKVKREYKYGNKKQTFEVINLNDDYIRIRDLTSLMGKSVSYDNKTKVTEIN